MIDTGKSLQYLCDKTLDDPSLFPADGVTHCNSAVYKICFNYGYDFYNKTTKDLMMANEIIDWMKTNWVQIDGDDASRIANRGAIAVAGQKANPHGHVAVVYPAGMVYSPKWKKSCPTICNVGERNGVIGANWAFASEPYYFTDQKNVDTDA